MDWVFWFGTILLTINLLGWEGINFFVLSSIAWSIVSICQRHNWTCLYQGFIIFITFSGAVMCAFCCVHY